MALCGFFYNTEILLSHGILFYFILLGGQFEIFLVSFDSSDNMQPYNFKLQS